VPGKQITVVSDDGDVAASGVDGVVHVRSEAGLAIEYVGAPAATTATRALPGHVTFGDIGRLDDEGYLTLSDRRSDMIVTGGVNVPSHLVEAVIAEHPAVTDVAVYGVPDTSAGQVVRAAVEVAHDAPATLADEVLALCRDRLPEHQRPVAVEIVDQLPRSATGKLVKRRLRAPYWEPHIGPIRIR
jgi:long-chain acyl-CoA synthetase